MMKLICADFLQSDCRSDEDKVDVVLTSPPYNTNKKATSRNLSNIEYSGYPHARYDSFMDNMTEGEYNAFTLSAFKKFDVLLKKEGVVLCRL